MSYAKHLQESELKRARKVLENIDKEKHQPADVISDKTIQKGTRLLVVVAEWLKDKTLTETQMHQLLTAMVRKTPPFERTVVEERYSNQPPQPYKNMGVLMGNLQGQAYNVWFERSDCRWQLAFHRIPAKSTFSR